MTAKKEKIIATALELFAKEGFAATSTSKVAKLAGVSEGLIFRHFTNKEGLLKAIVTLGEERAKILFADIVLETDPKLVILRALELGKTMSLDPEKANFWKLQYKIKWETESFNEQKMIPMQAALTNAFSSLNYKDPEGEATLLLIILDGLAMRFFLQDHFDWKASIDFLKVKYQV